MLSKNKTIIFLLSISMVGTMVTTFAMPPKRKSVERALSVTSEAISEKKTLVKRGRKPSAKKSALEDTEQDKRTEVMSSDEESVASRPPKRTRKPRKEPSPSPALLEKMEEDNPPVSSEASSTQPSKLQQLKQTLSGIDLTNLKDPETTIFSPPPSSPNNPADFPTPNAFLGHLFSSASTSCSGTNNCSCDSPKISCTTTTSLSCQSSSSSAVSSSLLESDTEQSDCEGTTALVLRQSTLFPIMLPTPPDVSQEVEKIYKTSSHDLGKETKAYLESKAQNLQQELPEVFSVEKMERLAAVSITEEKAALDQMHLQELNENKTLIDAAYQNIKLKAEQLANQQFARFQEDLETAKKDRLIKFRSVSERRRTKMQTVLESFLSPEIKT